MAPHGSLCSRFRARTFVRAHGRHAIVDSTRSAPPACCADGFLSLSSRAFWRPGGWENLCRLMCHCVRHIGLDNKHGQSVEATHSFLSRWRAGTELCADKQEEPSGKKGSMGSEKRQKSFRSDLKSVVTLLFPPRFDRAAFKIRRYLPERLNFPQLGSMRGAERLRVLDESCELRGQTWGEPTASGWISETSVSTFAGSNSPSSPSCRSALPVCRHRAPCQPSSEIGTSVSL